jgi:hypothetical protein
MPLPGPALRGLRAAVLAGGLLLAACAQSPRPTPLAEDGWRRVAPGLDYKTASPWPASRVHVLRLDLQERSLRLKLSLPAERGRSIDAFADTVAAAATFNVSFFDRRYTPRGLTVSDGMPWPEVLTHEASPLLACDVAQRCTVEIERDKTTAVRPGWHTVVAGTPWLVHGGKARSEGDDQSCPSLCVAVHPRTAIGLAQQGRQLVVVLVEGRRPEANGVALAPLAAYLRSLGVHDAINLDGGGSSTLWIDGAAVTNRPTNEPAERVLANVLHIVRVAH